MARRTRSARQTAAANEKLLAEISTGALKPPLTPEARAALKAWAKAKGYAWPRARNAKAPATRPRRRCGSPTRGSVVQGLVFPRATEDRPNGFTPARAKRWARKHGYKDDHVDVKPTTLRIRQFDPSRTCGYATIFFGNKFLNDVHGVLEFPLTRGVRESLKQKARR